jgi:hypothetical protein
MHMNPIPGHLAGPAPAAGTTVRGPSARLVVGNTMYIYAGRDEAATGQNAFVMREWHVLSSTNAANWTHHGARLSVPTFAWAGADAWASEVEPRNGKYYWYTSVNGNGAGWMDIGVAVGDTPLGPFTDAKGGPLISDSTPNSSGLNIDPTVFVDDDGQAYLYWGGYWGVRAVRLASNMIDTVGSVVTPQGLTNYWEAPWMFKRNGLYYMLYAANDTSGCVTSSSYACQRYATATNPLGPWTHRGVMLGQVSSTTNHAGAVEFNGQWYLVYHTANAPGGGNFRRSVQVDLMHFNADGTIQLVQQTTTGPPPNPSGTQSPPPTTPPPSGGNLATSGTAVCSFTSSWESCGAINTGGDPASSNIPGPNQGTRWGTYPQSGAQWAEVQWSSAQSVNQAQVYFFDDNQGIDVPSSWTVQYWNGSSYVNVPGASGYPITANQYNTVNFTSVNTTRLRIALNSTGTSSVGLLEVKAFGGTPPPPSGNLATSATAVCSFTSSWESCGAINTGGDPASSNIPGPNQGTRWGTWSQSGQQWAELQWSAAQNISRAQVYFFDDNQGIDVPSSWNLQYWNGSAYVAVPGASGYPIAANQYNTVTFTSVSTTRLRVVLNSTGTSSVGLLEVKAFTT